MEIASDRARRRAAARPWSRLRNELGRSRYRRLTIALVATVIEMTVAFVPTIPGRPESAAVFGPGAIVLSYIAAWVYAYTYGWPGGVIAALFCFGIQRVAVHQVMHDVPPYSEVLIVASSAINAINGAYLGRMRQLNGRLRRSERCFRKLAAHVSDLVFLVDAKGRATYVSSSHEATLQRSVSSLLGTRFREMFAACDRPKIDETIARAREFDTIDDRFEVTVRAKDGSERTIDMQVYNCLDDRSVRGVLFNGRDITDRKRAERMLETQAFLDPLTEMPNRSSLLARLEGEFVRGRFALIFADLDRFKEINDTYGHAAGDAVLHAVGRRIGHCVGGEAFAARLGGDEFAIVVPGGTARVALELAERVRAAIAMPIDVDRIAFTIGASFGVATSDEACGPAELLRRADVAMYAAKRARRDPRDAAVS